jgi:hypothetical protein
MRMKGDEEAEMAIAMIILVVGGGMIFFLLFNNFTSYTTELVAGQEKVNQAYAAHAAMACFRDGKQLASEQGITDQKAKDCVAGYYICMTDLWTGKDIIECESVFSYTAYLAFKTGNRVDMGMLNVVKI